MTYYLFAGQNYYPRSAPGDFVLRGTLEECRATLAAMNGYVVRRWADERIVLGVPLDYLGEVPDDDCEHYAASLNWWVIVDETMNIIEKGTA